MTNGRQFSITKRVEYVGLSSSLLLYAICLIHTIPRHEPWADEGQAWLLAKHLPLTRLFGTYIHYEGSPGLWHVFLWLLSKLNVTYSSMHWIVGLIAMGTVTFIAFMSPFPFLLRLFLPFGYFFIYQYAVVARSYSLFAPILFLLAWLWKKRHSNPLPVVLLLGLLANISVHGFAVALALWLVLGIEWFHLTERSPQLLFCVVILFAFSAFAAWSIYPAPDAGWVLTAHNVAKAEESIGNLSLAEESHPFIRPWPVKAQILWSQSIDLIKALRHPLGDRFQIGLIIWALLIARFAERGILRYAIPPLFLAEVSPPIAFHIYHAGLMWLLFLFLWWATWDEGERMLSAHWIHFERWQKIALTISVALCITLHLNWTWKALKYDWSYPYSPNRDGAVILKTYLDAGTHVDVAIPAKTGTQSMLGEYFVTGLEPYFAHEPFANMPFRFWFWGWDDSMQAKYVNDIAQKTHVILVEEAFEDSRYQGEEKKLVQLGYTRSEVVCGNLFYPDDISPPLCHAFYRPPQKQ